MAVSAHTTISTHDSLHPLTKDSQYNNRGGYGQGGYGQQNPYAQQPPPRNQYNEIPGNSFDSATRPAPAYSPYASSPYQQNPPAGNPYSNAPPPAGNPYSNTPPPAGNPYQHAPPQAATGRPYQNTPPPAASRPYQNTSPPAASRPYHNTPPAATGRPYQSNAPNGKPQPAAMIRPAGNDVEMGQLPVSASNPQAILDECSLISEGAAGIEKLLSQLESAHRRALNDTVTDSSSPTIREINSLNADIMAQYKANIERMKWIKSRPESGSNTNQRQIGLVDRKLKATYQRYLQVENDYEKRMREQMARQYRITKPDASEEEVRQACEDPSQQVFSQALLRSDRRGESRQVLSAVRDRHEAIQKIERQMEQLATLFQDMDRMVVEQEPLIQQIEKGAEETQVNVTQGNAQLDTAVVSAKGARRKKWICFWISMALLVIIAIILGIVIWWFTRPVTSR